MAYVSSEEENFVRMDVLLSGISQHAVRTFFDSHFPSASLSASLKKEYKTLLYLTNKDVINQSQWNLLFPSLPDVADSKTFDITLMITLLRHLTSINTPVHDFDHLPTAMETTPGADLAKIINYRNYQSNQKEGILRSEDFNTAWDDISGAIERLGGQTMKDECDELRIRPFGQSAVPLNIRVHNTEMLEDWKHNDEMFIQTRSTKHVLKCLKENSCVTITGSFGVGKTVTLRHVALQMSTDGYDVLVVSDPSDIVKFYNPFQKTLFVIDDLCGVYSIHQSEINSWHTVMKRVNDLLRNKVYTKIVAACRLQIYQDEMFKSLSIFNSRVCNMNSKTICLSKTEKRSIAELYEIREAYELTNSYDLYDFFPLLCKLYCDMCDNPALDIKKNPFLVYEKEIDHLLMERHLGKYCALALCVMFNNKLTEEMLIDETDENYRSIIENTYVACELDKGTSRLFLINELHSLEDTYIKKEQNVYKIKPDHVTVFLAFYYGKKILHCLIRNADSCLIKKHFILERNDSMDQFITVIPPDFHEMYIRRMIDDWSKGKLQDVFSNINMKIPQFRQTFLSHLNSLDISYQRELALSGDKHILREKSLSEGDDGTYDTVLLYCCYIGDVSLVEWCCIQGVDVNRCTHDDQSPVMIGCKHGHTEIVKMLLDKGADFNKYDRRGRSPGMIAFENCRSEIIKMFLDRGADYNQFDWWGQSPVIKASNRGHTEIVKMLLDNGADYNGCDSWGESALIKAIEHGHSEIVKLLLDKRSDDCYNCDDYYASPAMKACKLGHTEVVKIFIDKAVDVNSFGKSLLTEACKNGYTEIVNVLLDRGVHYNKYDRNDQSLILQACSRGNTEIVKKLLEKGADYNKCVGDGQSLLMAAYKHSHTDIVKMLLDRGAAYNGCDKYGQSALMKACGEGHTEIVKMLLDRGADYNGCDKYDQSPLMKACCNRRTDIVKMLLDRGAAYNGCDEYGQSALMKACGEGHTEIVKMLLDRGADYNGCDKIGQSPLMKACCNSRTDIVKILLDRGADYNKCNEYGQSALMEGCGEGHTEIVKMLLDRGADYNKCDKYDQSPIMTAYKHSHTDIVKMLLDRGAAYNGCDEYGQSALMKACGEGHTEIVKMLLDRGADYNGCDKIGQSPLMKACCNSRTDIVKIMLDRGADFNKCNKYGQSALMKACWKGYTEIVKMLLDRGADCTKLELDGRSPLIKACRHGHTEIEKMLLDRGADYKICDSDDHSLVRMAREQDHARIKKLLLENRADYKKDDNKGPSPVTMARKHGPTEIEKMIVYKEADLSPCDKWSQSPAMMAGEKDYTEKDARNSAPIDLLCDDIHLVCFTDTRLAMECVYTANSIVKGKTTLHGLFYQKDENSKIKSEYQIIFSFVKCQSKKFVDEKEGLHLAVVNKMSMLCRWLLANFSYDDNCLTQVLLKSFEIGYNDVIKVISWKITREFYKRFKRSLNENIVDIYPAYQCQCHCLTKGQQCLHVSKKLIVIESIAENIIGIPDTFCNFEITIFKYRDINESSNKPQTEMKDILKKMSDLNAPKSYSMFVSIVNGHVASSLFQQHRNLSLICPSNMKSSGYSSQHIVVPTSVCVQLFCHRKGIIPLGENHFPTNIRGVPTDVLQGRGHFASTTLRVGDKIGTTTSCGTLGGFYHYFGRYECFITCAHVLLGLSKLIVPLDDMSHNNPVDVIFNQQQGNQICGNLIRRIFNHDDPNSTSIDAALVDIKSPDFKIDENDIIRDNNGSARRCECLGLTTPFVNKNYCDHKFLCCTDSNVTTLAPGAVSGKILKDVKLEHSSAQDVYLKDLGNAAATTNGTLFHPLVMASPAHIQLPVGALTDRRIFTMYNQMVMNIPLQEGDSGTCIYITGNTPKNTGCVGMANSFCSGSGLALVTPIEEIIKAINR